MLEKIKIMDDFKIDLVEENAEKFFKQQNIIKAIKEYNPKIYALFN